MRAPACAEARILMGDSHVRLEPGRRIHHGAWMASNPFPGSSRPACQSQLTFSCFASPPDTSMTGAPWATQFLGPLPLLFFAVVVVSSASFTPLITRMHPIVLLPPALPQTVLRPFGSFGPLPGIGQKVLLVTESAATEWALGWTHLGSAIVAGGGVGLVTGGQTMVPFVPLRRENA